MIRFGLKRKAIERSWGLEFQSLGSEVRHQKIERIDKPLCPKLV